MTRRVYASLLGAILLALGALGTAGCAGRAGFRARVYEANSAVRAHDELRAEVVLGRADGVARRGGCAVCRY